MADHLELRGLLGPDGFELLRVHERDADTLHRRTLRRPQRIAAHLTARLTDEAGRSRGHGTVGVVSSEQGGGFDDTGDTPVPRGTTARVRVVVPLPAPGVGGVVELLDGGTVIWREQVAPEPPRVEVRAELGEESLDVSWRTEPDAPVDLFVRSPEGASVRIGSRVSGGQVVLDRRLLPGGPMIVVARTSAGLRVGTGEAETLETEVHPDRVGVILEREAVPQGQPVTATAVRTDPWGRSATSEGVRWLVDDEEVPGSGPVTVVEPVAGDHRVVAAWPDGLTADAALAVRSS